MRGLRKLRRRRQWCALRRWAQWRRRCAAAAAPQLPSTERGTPAAAPLVAESPARPPTTDGRTCFSQPCMWHTTKTLHQRLSQYDTQERLHVCEAEAAQASARDGKWGAKWTPNGARAAACMHACIGVAMGIHCTTAARHECKIELQPRDAILSLTSIAASWPANRSKASSSSACITASAHRLLHASCCGMEGASDSAALQETRRRRDVLP